MSCNAIGDNALVDNVGKRNYACFINEERTYSLAAVTLKPVDCTKVSETVGGIDYTYIEMKFRKVYTG